MRVRKCLVGVGLSLTMFASLAAPTVAGNAGDGSDYGTQPGFDVAQSHTRCSGAGAFGYLGKDLNMKRGADGTVTGNNNSGLCGNPQDD